MDPDHGGFCFYLNDLFGFYLDLGKSGHKVVVMVFGLEVVGLDLRCVNGGGFLVLIVVVSSSFSVSHGSAMAA